MNAVEIEEAVSELAKQPFDPVNFPYAFLEAFGNKATTIQRLRSGSSNKSDIAGGVLQNNNVHIAVTSEGNVSDTLARLRESAATAKQKAKFILATDGKEFQAEDLSSDVAPIVCEYKDFPDHFGFFLPLAGISTVKQIRESSFDIKATGRLNRLYVELLKDNPKWGTGERRHDMNHFMAKLIFCFFAEDTKIFDELGQFTKTIQQMSVSDSSNTHEVIGEIFRAMSTTWSARARAKLPRWADFFPYVNGGLFSGNMEIPRFSKIARSYLLHIGSLEWQKINPDIFGSMIQAVAEDEERGALGMHYTSVPNILRVLNPLFLDDLRSQLEKAGKNSKALNNLRKRLSKIRVFDPACGSGNFLVIAYKEMRQIEFEINSQQNEKPRASEINLTSFRGIELRDFPAEIARLALIIAEYQCDVIYRGHKNALAEFLPLESENWITCGNALRVDWLNVCPPSADDDTETYLCGNPPYLGSTWQSAEQKSDLKAIFCDRTKTWKTLDYVTGWFMKAAEYGQSGNVATAFVATNSICQGQHVAFLWPLIFETGHSIAFAHTSFKWANLASHNAGVAVIIVGLSNRPPKVRRLFSLADDGGALVKEGEHINAYLVHGPNIFVAPSDNVLCGMSKMDNGNKAVDGGHLLLEPNEVIDLSLTEAERSRLVKRFAGSQEAINGTVRYCIWIPDEARELAYSIPAIRSRIELVRKERLASSKKMTRDSAARPHAFQQVRQRGDERLIVVPRVSSESRDYVG